MTEKLLTGTLSLNTTNQPIFWIGFADGNVTDNEKALNWNLLESARKNNIT